LALSRGFAGSCAGIDRVVGSPAETAQDRPSRAPTIAEPSQGASRGLSSGLSRSILSRNALIAGVYRDGIVCWSAACLSKASARGAAPGDAPGHAIGSSRRAVAECADVVGSAPRQSAPRPRWRDAATARPRRPPLAITLMQCTRLLASNKSETCWSPLTSCRSRRG
jgi:hypothetical protein